MQVAFKQGAGVAEILFGVGRGGSKSVKRFVENADDSLLFDEWRYFGSRGIDLVPVDTGLYAFCEAWQVKVVSR